MAATRRQHKNQKESAWVPPLQRDPGPWNRLLLNWLATLAIIMVFGLVMLYSASYTTGYLRMGDSLHYIKQQAICMANSKTNPAISLSTKNGALKKTLTVSLLLWRLWTSATMSSF